MDDDFSKDIKEQTERCVREITQRWVYFINTLRFKDDVPLSGIIDSFTQPIQEFTRINYPLLHSAKLFLDDPFPCYSASQYAHSGTT